MYKIKVPSQAELERFFDKAKGSILNRIDSWLNNAAMGVKVNCRSKKLDLTARVSRNSLTHSFLTRYQDEIELKKLMLGSMADFIQCINELKQDAVNQSYPAEYVFENMTLKKYERIENGGAAVTAKVTRDIDHFNTIVKDVFLEHGYDGKKANGDPVFRKDEFVKLLDLRICPYCGRAFIYSVQRAGGKTEVKPQIDHFLPKSKYPFLALSFMNLIPSCQTCNMKDCKGDNDPVKNYNAPASFRIQYPYEFDASKIKFEYVLKGSHYNKDDNFEVNINYQGYRELKKGGDGYLKLGAFYKQHNVELACMYRQMMILTSKASFYYGNFKIDKSWLKPTPMMILGYNLNETNSRKYMLYKFKHDIYFQMMSGEVKKLFE